MMSRTRRKNGTYVMSEKQKVKLRKSVKKTYKERDVFGPELRKKFSETMKKSWREGKITSENHWAKTSEGKRKLSLMFKGKKLSSAARANISIAAQKRLRTKRETHYTSAKGGFREDIQIYCRSNWEANFARILNFLQVDWEYEAKTFQFSNMSYTPDFFVQKYNLYIEIKGRWNDRSIKQVSEFNRNIKEYTLVVVGPDEYNILRDNFKSYVNWEGK